MFGWRGARLIIDLAGRETYKEFLSQDFFTEWLGGGGLNISVFSTDAPRHCAGDRAICLASGPLSGTLAPPGPLTSAAAIPPHLEEEVASCPLYIDFIGDMAMKLKYAGYDQLVIWGEASEPVVIVVNDHETHYLNMGDLWERDRRRAIEGIEDELGVEDMSILIVDQEGKDDSSALFSIRDDQGYTVGPPQLAAALAAKNIKAIALRGTGEVTLADPVEFARLCWQGTYASGRPFPPRSTFTTSSPRAEKNTDKSIKAYETPREMEQVRWYDLGWEAGRPGDLWPRHGPLGDERAEGLWSGREPDFYIWAFLGLCPFSPGDRGEGRDLLVKLVNAATGVDFTWATLEGIVAEIDKRAKRSLSGGCL